MKQLKYGVLYEDGPLHPELTPLDLFVAGFTIREHRFPGKWCWWESHSSGGQSFGVARDTVQEAVEDARWLMTADCYRGTQPTLMVA